MKRITHEEFKEWFDNKYSNCLFRYRSFGEDDEKREKYLSAFKADRLYFAAPIDFNDPYDTLIFADQGKIIGHIIGNIEGGMDNYLDNLKKTDPLSAMIGRACMDGAKREQILEDHCQRILDLINGTKILIRRNAKMISFTEVYDSMLMWAHYADNHKGYVLIYDKDDIRNARRYGSDDLLTEKKTVLSEVEYVDRQLDLTEEVENFIRYNVLENMGDVEVPDATIGQKKIRRAIVQKSNEWGYEQEWRLISRTIEYLQPSPLKYIECKPKGIILGSRCFDDNDSNHMVKAAKKKGLPVYRMFLDPCDREFKLHVDENGPVY